MGKAQTLNEHDKCWKKLRRNIVYEKYYRGGTCQVGRQRVTFSIKKLSSPILFDGVVSACENLRGFTRREFLNRIKHRKIHLKRKFWDSDNALITNNVQNVLIMG
ncbi:hypothetical protein JTB14_017034 [Gonioctena quinquepunctata]|nr:hypothetical protein JTB14_017034 [Gonioctena quinquepunctata]